MRDEAKARVLEAAAFVVPERVDHFLQTHRPSTPCVIIDLAIISEQYLALRELFRQAQIYYAVKANPAANVLDRIAALGANFDLASMGEIDRCRGLGIGTDRLSFGNTIKREADIRQAHAAGIDLFAFDSLAELEKLARAAPSSRVFCRMSVRNVGAEWPLTRKFGCAPDMAAELLKTARTLGLRPSGVSFHVGSQQTDPEQWRPAIAAAAKIFRACAHGGLDLAFLNVGGGFPGQYRTPIPALSAYADAIEGALTKHFGGARPQIMVEPGRYLVADAGVLRAEVLLISKKSQRAAERWVYLDAGRYNGLTETLDERIHYRIHTPYQGKTSGPVILAGPTCDSTDVIYRRAGYALPLDLAIGDAVDFLSAGAYTASYASVEFNGFAPIQTYCI